MRLRFAPAPLLCAFAALATIGFAGPAAAEPFPVSELPPALHPWVPWVLDSVPEHACPVVDSEAICAWPGELELDLRDDGGSFEQRVVTDRTLLFALPGDESHWPQAVKLNGRPAAVLEKDGRPAVRLSPGEARINGELLWPELPEGIRVPSSTALIDLKVGGEPVPFPRRDADGLVWLQGGGGAGLETEQLNLEVFRRIEDGVPLTVETRIVLRAAGRSRQVDLGPVLLDQTTPLEVVSGVPARVDGEGHLRVQIRAGTHRVEIVSLTDGAPGSLAMPKRDSDDSAVIEWPAQEVWVWQADEELRQVVISGAPGIDPARTSLPEEWSDLPAFLLTSERKLTFETRRRGEPNPPPDDISLAREIWMDLDGAGYTIRDRFSGELNRTWRLDLAPPGELGHAAVDGEDQLITSSPGSSEPGVELRHEDLSMVAEWRLEDDSRRLPAVGWSEDVQSLRATLHLPPGWTLLSARGVDELPGTWWEEWDLFSFFFVLLVALAIGRLTRWWYGLIGLVAFALLHQSPDYPFGLWIFAWIALLIFLALLEVIPEGKLRIATRICWWIGAIALVMMLVPYTVSQVRTGLYPQIDQERARSSAMQFAAMADEETGAEVADRTVSFETKTAPPAAGIIEGEAGAAKKKASVKRERTADEMVASVEKMKRAGAAKDGRTAGSYSAESLGLWRSALQQDPKAVVQTGPGVPRWRWRSWDLDWSGPVDKEHDIRLYLISPTTNLLLSLLRVVLLVLLAVRVITGGLKPRRSKPGSGPEPTAKDDAGDRRRKTSAAAAAGAVLLAVQLPPSAARATEIPEQNVLTELAGRLTRPAECRPDCVSTSLLEISVADDEIGIAGDVHAGEESSWRIPGPARNWVPGEVSVDGRRTTAIALLEDGFLHVRLEPGPHSIEIAGPVPAGDAVTLEFGETPHRVEVDAEGWNVEGVRPDGRAERSVQLSRLVRPDEKTAGGASENALDERSYPPWLEVTRTLDLGIPWLVHTEVRRISPTGSPVMVKIPLLSGESVTESDLQVESKAVVVSLGRDDDVLSWSSTLAEASEIELAAPRDKRWSEVWVLRCSTIWQCDHRGVPPVHHVENGRLEPMFRPWPGEQLRLDLLRPPGVEGQSTTVDAARLKVSPGMRLVSAELSLRVRSSRGGEQLIGLPGKASIQSLAVNGEKQPFRQQGKQVEVTLQPGSQNIEIGWQQPGGITALYRVPQVSLGGTAANVSVVLELPGDRWLLWAGGPDWGPAVLFWGFLLSILLAAVILGRVPLSPLKGWQWALLALGLTQVPVAVSLIVVGWFFALAWRRRNPPRNFVLHNMLQVVFGVWTAVALVCLVVAVYTGLAVQPDMQVAGCSSSDTALRWYTDRVDGALPCPWVLSAPILIWKLIMLLWSLWLAWSLIRWARWGWRAYSHEVLWRSIPLGKPVETGAKETTSKRREEDSEP
ncbi:MAG: hypothetical protein R6V85_08385 [Polyangia bacterium]